MVSGKAGGGETTLPALWFLSTMKNKLRDTIPCWAFKAISVTSAADFPGLILGSIFFSPCMFNKKYFNVYLYGIRKITIYSIE